MKVTREVLGRAIIELQKDGHIVMSVAFNANVADLVIIAKKDGWTEAVIRARQMEREN